MASAPRRKAVASAPRRNAVLERAPLQNPQDLLSERGAWATPQVSHQAGLRRPKRQTPAGAPVGARKLFALPRRKTLGALKAQRAAKVIAKAASEPVRSTGPQGAGRARLTKRSNGKIPSQRAHLVPKQLANSGDANAERDWQDLSWEKPIAEGAPAAKGWRRQNRVPVILSPAAPRKEELFQNEPTSHGVDEHHPWDRLRKMDNHHHDRFGRESSREQGFDEEYRPREARYVTHESRGNVDEHHPLDRLRKMQNHPERSGRGLSREQGFDKEYRAREDKYVSHDSRENVDEHHPLDRLRKTDNLPERSGRGLSREQGFDKEYRSREDRYASHDSRGNVDEQHPLDRLRKMDNNPERSGRGFSREQGFDKEYRSREDRYASHDSRGNVDEHHPLDQLRKTDNHPERSGRGLSREQGFNEEYRSREDRYASHDSRGNMDEHLPLVRLHNVEKHPERSGRGFSREQEFAKDHRSRQDTYASHDSRGSEGRHCSEDHGPREEHQFLKDHQVREGYRPREERRLFEESRQRVGSPRGEHQPRNRSQMRSQDAGPRDARSRDAGSRDVRPCKEEQSEPEGSDSPRAALEVSLEEVPLSFAGLSGPLSLALGSAGWENVLHDEPRRSFVSLKRHAFRAETLQQWFDQLRTHLQWRRFSKAQSLPRSGIWLTSGKCACPYRHGGRTWPATAMEPWFLEITDKVRRACGLREWPNSCSGTLYEGGGEAVDWQADDQALFDATGRDALIISLSLGAARNFELSPHDSPGRVVRLSLQDGDLCSMEGRLQRHYKHRVPKELDVEQDCINLTWRWIVVHEAGCRAAGRAGVRKSRPDDNAAPEVNSEKRQRRAERFGPVE